MSAGKSQHGRVSAASEHSLGKVNSSKARLPNVSMVQTAGQAKTKLIKPNPQDASCGGQYSFDQSAVPEDDLPKPSCRTLQLEQRPWTSRTPEKRQHIKMDTPPDPTYNNVDAAHLLPDHDNTASLCRPSDTRNGEQLDKAGEHVALGLDNG